MSTPTTQLTDLIQLAEEADRHPVLRAPAHPGRAAVDAADADAPAEVVQRHAELRLVVHAHGGHAWVQPPEGPPQGLAPAELERLRQQVAAFDRDLLFDHGVAGRHSPVDRVVVRRGGRELFTAQRPPAAWPAGLADLQSRFRALATVSIAPPGDAELAQILGKLLRDRQVRPGQRLIEFLLRRIERSAGGARAAIEALDQAAALRGERINLKLAQDYYAESTQDTRS